MKKRLFEILDEMNVNDTNKGTELLSVSGNFISADKVKQGTKVCMGSDGSAVFDIMNDKVIPILLLINREEYEKLK